MRQVLSCTFVGFICSLLIPAFAMADVGVTYHGRLLKPNGQPVNATNVQFQLQIRTPSSTSCLLFQETHVRDLSETQGVFSITLNKGASVGNTEAFTLAEAFQNHGKKIIFPPGKCSGDNEYTPNPVDGRQLFVSFNDGTFSGWEPLPVQNIAFVPLAVESMTVGGHKAGNLFRVEDAAGLPALMGAWSIANYTKLTDLIGNVTISGGNASIGGNAAGFTGSLSGDVTGGQSSTKVEKIQGNSVLAGVPSDKQVLTWNHANLRWEPANVPVAGNPDWGDITGKPTEFAPGGNAGGDLLGSTYPNPVIANNTISGSKIADGGVAFSKIAAGSATGQVLQYETGVGWKAGKLLYTDLIKAGGGSPWPTTPCTAGKAVIWQSATDGFECAPISITETDPTVKAFAKNDPSSDFDTTGGVLALKTVPITRGGTGAVSQSGAINNLLPSQGSNSGKILQTDGTNVSWVNAPATGITSINGATGSSQTFQTAQSNTAPTFTRTGDVHTLNIPQASTNGVTAGTISYTDYQAFSGKQNALGFTPLNPANNLSELTATAATARTNLGLGTAATKAYGTAVGNLVEVDAGGKIPAVLLPDQSGPYFTQGGNAFGAPAVLGTTEAQPLHLQTGGTDKITILADGNVGIGTTLPDNVRLEINGPPRGSLVGYPANYPWNLHSSDSSPMAIGVGGGIGFQGRIDGSTTQWTFSGVHGGKENASSGDYSGYLSFHTRPSGAPESERMRISSSGDVGIGTDTPTERLDLFSNAYTKIKMTGATAAGFHATTSTASSKALAFGAGSLGTALTFDNSGYFAINSDTKANVTNLGGTPLLHIDGTTTYVGIGTATPGDKLHVAGKIRAEEICDEAGGNCKDISSGWGAGGDIDGIVTNSGSGLSGGTASGTATLSLVTDGSTLEVNGSNQLQVKDSGITSAKIASLSVNKITSGAGLYLTYAPNGAACTPGQVLKWNSSRWECGVDSTFASPLTTKGDIYIRNGTVDTRLPAGADGKVLKADSAQGTGLVWGDAIATDISSLATTGIVQRNGAGSYSTVTVASPLTYTGGTLGLDTTAIGDVKLDGNTVSSTMTVGTNSAHDLALETGGTTKMTVQNGGDVGIGTATPTAKLTVAADTNVAIHIGNKTATVSGSTAAPLSRSLEFKGYNNHQLAFIRSDDMASSALYSNLIFGVKQSGTTATEFMRIDGQTGNVGIGTATPTAPLYVRKDPTHTSGKTQTISNYAWYAPASAPAANTTVIGGQNWVDTGGSASLTNVATYAEYSGAQHTVNTTLGALYGNGSEARNGSASGTVSSATGSHAYVNNELAGTITSATGLKAQIDNTSTGSIPSATGINSTIKNISTGSISNAMGLYTTVLNPTGTVTTGFGVYIDSIEATNKYGLYQADATATNFFSGNVGIGTANPQSPLHVMQTSAVSALMLERAGDANSSVEFKSSTGFTAIDGGGSSGYLRFHTAGSPRLFINSSGNVGIGTSTPARRLHVNHSVNSDYTMQITNGGGSGHGLLINAGATGEINSTPLNVAAYSGASLFYVRGDGGYYHLGSPISTKESKKEIRVFDENALSLLKDIQVVSYSYKMDADDRARRIGFLANDEKHVYDERLTNKQRGFATETIVGVMIKAFQEVSENISRMVASLTSQGEQIESLEKTVTVLQGQLQETKAENQDLRMRLDRLERAFSGSDVQGTPARKPAQQAP